VRKSRRIFRKGVAGRAALADHTYDVDLDCRQQRRGFLVSERSLVSGIVSMIHFASQSTQSICFWVRWSDAGAIFIEAASRPLSWPSEARSNAFANPLVEENNLPGAEDWMLTRPALGREIEGYASKGYASICSASSGQTVALYINTAAPFFTIEIFRMGWYGGRGARRIWGPLTARGVRQPIPAPDPETGLVDCNWHSSTSIVIGAD
jgi:hypothetical protein